MNWKAKFHPWVLLIILSALMLGFVAPAMAEDGDDDDGGLSSMGLLAYWPFDEDSGTDAFDVTGNGYDGTVHRAAWADGLCGSALEFFGKDTQFEDFSVGTYVETPFRLTQVTDATEFTLTAWFKSPSQKLQYIMGYYNGTDMIATLLNHPQPNDIHFNLRDPSVQRNLIEVTTGLNLDDNEWHHIVFRRKNTSELDIYVDGSLQPKTVKFDDVLPDHSQRADWFIGATNDVFHNRLTGVFNGTLDEVKIYDHALTDDEIAAQFSDPCREDGDGDGVPDEDDDDVPDEEDDGVPDEDDDGVPDEDE